MKAAAGLFGLAFGLFLTGSTVFAQEFPESAHPYDDNSDLSWTYSLPAGTEYMKVTFSEDTETEDSFDWICFADEKGDEIQYTGTALAGKTFYLPGDSFTIRLTSDGSYSCYGFRITDIQAVSKEEYELPRFEIENGMITAYTGSVENLTVPGVIDGQTVTAIGDNAFADNAVLRSVTLPDTVETIGFCAFEQCSELETVHLPSSLTGIGSYAFYDCHALKNVELPEGLLVIDEYSFAECTMLENIDLPESLTEIGLCAFAYCSSLTEVTIPDNVTRIGSNAFYANLSLTTVRLSPRGTDLGSSAFASCYQLQAVEGPIDSMDDTHYFAFAGCSALKELEFGDNMGEVPSSFISEMEECLSLVVSVGNGSGIHLQLKDDPDTTVVYVVRGTGETNRDRLPLTTLRGKVEYVVRTATNDGMTQYEKAIALHDWLIANAEYDYTFTNYGPEGVLMEGTGVCQSYTLAYQALLNAVRIENDTEFGYDHIWNMIRLDGEWYHIDVTWDDDGDASDYEFFCVSNYAIDQVENHECYSKRHIATATDYNWSYVHGELDDLLQAGRSAISQCIADGSCAFEFELMKYYEDYHGTRNRTALLILQKDSYTLNGKPAEVVMEYGRNLNGEEGAYASGTVRVWMPDPDFMLPAELTEIGEEAFMHISASVISLPDGVTEIGNRAFADCGSLQYIFIPDSCVRIADSAFSGDTGLVICCGSGSAAEAWAVRNGFAYECVS